MIRYAMALVLPLVAILAVSGCITNTTTGNGVVIEEFTTGGISELYPGEPVTFYLKVRNTGSVEAEGVFAELLGLDEDWAKSSSDLGTIEGVEMLPQETRCQYINKGEHFTLQPPDTIYNTAGETATCTWKYRTPPIPQGMNPTYGITARAFYDYRTDLVKSFTILSTSELLKYKQQGLGVPMSTVSSTRSPITITTESRDPIRFWEDKISFPLAITVSNTGGGMVCLKGQCKKTGSVEWNKLRLTINPVSSGLEVSPECSEYRSGSVMEVWPNRDNTIICDIEVSGVSDITGFEERILGISAEYSYFTDAETSIKVL